MFLLDFGAEVLLDLSEVDGGGGAGVMIWICHSWEMVVGVAVPKRKKWWWWWWCGGGGAVVMVTNLLSID